MIRVILTFLILSFVLSSFSYSQTTETNNTSSASFNSSSDSIRLPDCNGSYIKKCFGTTELGDGDIYVGEFENNKRQGIGTTTSILENGKFRLVYVGNYELGKPQGEGVFILKYGSEINEVRYYENRPVDQKNYLFGSLPVQKAFPDLIKSFQSLSLSSRKSLQESLKAKGMYSSSIDGQWGRNTLIGVARFSSEYLRTVNLNDKNIVDEVISGLQLQHAFVRVEPATQTLLENIARKKENASKVKENAYRLENTFKEYGDLSRKQIQWSLKKRGYYRSTIDGIWGSGTKNAVVKYAQDMGLNAEYPDEIYNAVSRGFNVPNSFVVVKKPPPPKQTKSRDTNALGKLLLLGALCSMTPDAGSCLAGAADASTGRKETTSSTSEDYTSPSFSNKERGCTDDYSCGFGEICMKAPLKNRGVCAVAVDRYGKKTYKKSRKSYKTRHYSDGCFRSSECPKGFKCDKTYRMCVKR